MYLSQTVTEKLPMDYTGQLNQFHFCNVDPDGNPFEYGRISWGELNQ
jgi:hypothetical protein